MTIYFRNFLWNGKITSEGTNFAFSLPDTLKHFLPPKHGVYYCIIWSLVEGKKEKKETKNFCTAGRNVN